MNDNAKEGFTGRVTSGPIESAWYKAAIDQVVTACSEVIAERAKAEGVVVYPETQKSIEDAVREAMADSSFSIDVKLEGETDGDRTISLNDSDEREIERRLDAIYGKFADGDSAFRFIEGSADRILESLDASWASIREAKAVDMEAFKAEVSEYWGKPIDLLRMMAFVVFELGNDVVDCLNKGIEAGEIERSYALDLSISFQARASQLLNEIIELLACGFPEAALARWRTLHELHVTAAFVFERGGDLPERYILHGTVETYKDAKAYNECCETLGYEPLEDGVIDDLEEKVRELEGRFGKSFERTYGWAADALQNQNPRIRDIEEAAGYAHSRAHYGFASLNVHANAKGILYRISQPENQEGLIAGPSVWGLADPITCTAVTITQLLSVLNKQWGTMDSTAGILVLERLMKRVNDSLEDAGPCDEEITDGFPGSDEPIMPDDE